MADSSDIEKLIDEINPQVDFDLKKKQVDLAFSRGKTFTLNELLDLWNEDDLPEQIS